MERIKEPWEAGADPNRRVYGFSARDLPYEGEPEEERNMLIRIWNNAVSTARRFNDDEALHWLLSFSDKFQQH